MDVCVCVLLFKLDHILNYRLLSYNARGWRGRGRANHAVMMMNERLMRIQARQFEPSSV